MSNNRSPLLADLPHRVRERTQAYKAGLRQWWSDVRHEPALLWRTTAVRLSCYLILGICAFLALRWVATSFLPSKAEVGAQEAVPLAILYVACTNPECRESYTTRQPMDFEAWPLTCPKCGKPTVYRAKLCPKCHRWYATAPGQPRRCPFCAAEEPEEPQDTSEPKPTNRDDAEDGW